MSSFYSAGMIGAVVSFTGCIYLRCFSLLSRIEVMQISERGESIRHIHIADRELLAQTPKTYLSCFP